MSLDDYIKDVIRDNISTALYEAKIELAFAKEQSSWALFFRRLKRCWYYGWTGFFNPKQPVYIRPYSPQKKVPEPQPQHQECSFKSSRENKSLPYLIDELNKEITLQKLNEFRSTFADWELKKTSNRNLSVRLSIHNLYDQLMTRANKNEEPCFSWLKSHQELFFKNGFKMIEQLLIQNKDKELIPLAKAVDLSFIEQTELSKEFIITYPELIPVKDKTRKVEAHSSDLFSTASSLMQTAWSWTNHLKFFNKTHTPTSDAEVTPMVVKNTV